MDYGEPPHEREPVTTIAWRLAHLIVGFASTNGVFGRVAATDSTFCYAGSARGALRQLDDEYEHWVEVCAASARQDSLNHRATRPHSPTHHWRRRCCM
jgi:hypothetical protein